MATSLLSQVDAQLSHHDILWDIPIGGILSGEAVSIPVQLHRSIAKPLQHFAAGNDIGLPDLLAALAIRFSYELQNGGGA